MPRTRSSGGQSNSIPLFGLLNVNKPQGVTSHDVVDQVRRIVGERRIGHTGTLDPLATGVLVLCVGRATRIAEYLAGTRKEYEARIRLGTVTNTFDAEGEVVASREWRGLTLDTVEAALAGFVGQIAQTPPMYSALKRDGKPLYRLARAGITVEREPRTVEIYALVLRRWEPPDLDLTVVCSGGTYIRSLAHDLGEVLGSGAYLAGLVRWAVGRFRLEQAATLAELSAARTAGTLATALQPLQAGLEMPGITLTAEVARQVQHGCAVALDLPAEADICYTCAADGQVLAILRRLPDSGLWQPEKVLLPAETER